MLCLAISDLVNLAVSFRVMTGCVELTHGEMARTLNAHRVLWILAGLCYKVAGHCCSLFPEPSVTLDITDYSLLLQMLSSFGFWLPVLISSGCYNRLPKTGWLKQQTFISHSAGRWKSKTRVLAWLGSGEDPLSGLQLVIIWLCPHMGESRERERGREGDPMSPPFKIRALIPLMRAPPS